MKPQKIKSQIRSAFPIRVLLNRPNLARRLRSSLALCTLLFFSVAVRAADYVFVVDVSGSMTETVSPVDKRIRVAVVQKALKQYLPALPQPCRIYLMAFHNRIVSQKEIILHDPASLREASEWVDNLEQWARENGQTHLWTTLRRGLQVASAYSQKNPTEPVTVRVLTDGEDNEGVTTLERVLAEFPLVDGAHIKGNLVLLGDLELKTKLALPPGAFEITQNVHWNDLFPPVVLVIPQQPCAGDEVRFVENTHAIYAGYQWLIGDQPAGTEKVLARSFENAGTYQVTLRVKGLQNTWNSSTVQVSVREKAAFEVQIVGPTELNPDQPVTFVARTSLPAKRFAWTVNGMELSSQPDFAWKAKEEGSFQIGLSVWSDDGRLATNSRQFSVKEAQVTARIICPNEAIAGQTVQFVADISGPYGHAEWQFGDGATSQEKDPEHTFSEASTGQVYPISLRVVSLGGHQFDAPKKTITVKPTNKAMPPVAAFDVVEATLRVGDAVHLVDESQGFVEKWSWQISGERFRSEKNPIVKITTEGKKTVTLDVHGPGGDSEVSKEIVVLPRFDPVHLAISASRTSGVAPLTVQLASHVSGDIKSVSWDFGDGQSSTNPNPSHRFTGTTNYSVMLTVRPKDESQAPIQERLIIHVAKPLPAWAKFAALAALACAVASAVSWYARRRLQESLRLLVFYWIENESICRRADLRHADELVELSPYVPIRLRRFGKAQELAAEALNGAVLVAEDGQERASQNIGRGMRLVVKKAPSASRAVAISVNQKPCRPTPAAHEEGDGLEGYPKPVPGVPTVPVAAGNEFSWE